jgi:hypothetical protein
VIGAVEHLLGVLLGASLLSLFFLVVLYLNLAYWSRFSYTIKSDRLCIRIRVFGLIPFPRCEVRFTSISAVQVSMFGNRIYPCAYYGSYFLFNRWVSILKRDGVIREIIVTPRDREKFIRQLELAINAYRMGGRNG